VFSIDNNQFYVSIITKLFYKFLQGKFWTNYIIIYIIKRTLWCKNYN